MGLLWSTFYLNLQARVTSILKKNNENNKNKNVLCIGIQGHYSKFKQWNFRKTLQIDQSS